MGFLDITDPEIDSLVSYLMSVEGDSVNKQSSDDSSIDGKSPGFVADERGIEAKTSREDGTDEPGMQTTIREIYSRDEYSDKNASTASLSPFTNADATKKMRPLPLVLAALEAAAVRAPSNEPHEKEGNFIRGPEVAAVPNSAKRACQVLRDLQILWRRNDRRNTNYKREPLSWQGSEEFSDEELGAAVSLFDVDGSGHIPLQYVVAVFRTLRVGSFVRRRPPMSVIPILISIGRHLAERGITAAEFTKKAASVKVKAILSPSRRRSSFSPPCFYDGDTTDTSKGRQTSQNNDGRAATEAQMNEYLSREMLLTAKKCRILLDFVEDNGLVWGAHLAGAIRRARRELAHYSLKRLDEKRSERSNVTWESTDSMTSEEALIEPEPTGYSTSIHQQVLAATKINALKRKGHQRRSEDNGAFNQYDASLVLGIFAVEVGGLRNLTADAAVALWRALKRRSHGVHAYQAGRSVARRLRQLLHHRAIRPLQWFATLDAVGGEADDDSVTKTGVPVSSVVSGVKKMIAAKRTPPEETVAMDTVAIDENSSVDTLDANEGSNNRTNFRLSAGNEGSDQWDEKQLSILATHLNPCGEEVITRLGFQEGLRDCGEGQVIFPDASQLAAASRFEAALSDVGNTDVCGLLRALLRRGRGDKDLVNYVRGVVDYVPTTSCGLDTEVTKGRVVRALAVRKNVS